jgi:hypothetical protein
MEAGREGGRRTFLLSGERARSTVCRRDSAVLAAEWRDGRIEGQNCVVVCVCLRRRMYMRVQLSTVREGREGGKVRRRIGRTVELQKKTLSLSSTHSQANNQPKKLAVYTYRARRVPLTTW